MDNSSKCPLCGKGFTQHSPSILCTTCNHPVHPKCLPLYFDSDIAYSQNPDSHWSCPSCLNAIFPFFTIENNDELINPIDSIFRPNIEELETLLLEPYDLNDEGGILDDIDPDLHFYNEHASNLPKSCKYIQPEKLRTSLNTLTCPIALSILHLNIRSSRQNFSAFNTFLHLLDHPFSLLGLTETWLKPHNAQLFNIDGYTHEISTRDSKTGGGLSLYVKETLEYKVRHDLNHVSDDSEMLWIEIEGASVNHQKNVVVGLTYRRPGSDVEKFLELFTTKLNTITEENKYVIHMGDFNLDLLKHDTHAATNTFLDLNLTHSLLPVINKPTRVTRSSATIIDNIFSNIHSQDESISCLFPIDISDHFPICYFSTKSKNSYSSEEPIFKKRDMSRKNTDKFNHLIRNHDWTSVTELLDTQDAYSSFHNTFTTYFNTSFPFKPKLSTYKSRLPWLSVGIKTAIKRKNALYNKQLSRPTITNIKKYKTYRNHLNHLIKASQRLYYQNQLLQNKTNLRKSWQVINTAINRSKVKNKSIKSLTLSGKKVTDPKDIAEHFNTYFTNIGSVLDRKIPPSNLDPASFIKEANPHTIYLRPCLNDEVAKVIVKLKQCAAGWDGIPSSLIQENSVIITPCLTHIINLSLTQGMFPKELKMAILIPIFKAGAKDDAGNYRPVSLLTMFSKIFERIFYNRLSNFFKIHKLLYELQFGFREGHSTQLTIITLMDRIISALERGNYTVGIFLDFSKAFDTVNHEILLSKLNKYGIRGVANNWVRSYLANRSQYSFINDCKSSTLEVKCGVPQGSILGPLLFLIYINDLPNFSSQITSILFADDSNLFLDGPELPALETKINSELPKLVAWLQANRLSLNIGKTHTMVFSPKKTQSSNVRIIINGIVLETVTKTKFLGLILDNKLSWKNHALYLSNKMSKSIGILSLARKYLDQTTLLQLYYSFIYPYVIYCNLAWGNASDTALWPIFRTQKLAIRIIANLPRRSSSMYYCKTKSVLRLPEIFLLTAATFMFKFKNSLLPDIFSTFFITNQDIHTHRTRAATKLRIPLTKSTIANKFIKKAGVGLWNDLDTSITNVNTIGAFKNQIKRHLLNSY
jgi:hypothetical protein